MTHVQRLERRSRAWKEFELGRFDDALDLLPDPAEADPSNRRREWMMLARIQARRGDAWKAAVALAEAKRESSTNHNVPLEIGAVEVLVEIAAGHRDLAWDQLRDCLDLLEQFRAEVLFPTDQDALSAQAAVGDLTVAATILDRPEMAAALSSMAF